MRQASLLLVFLTLNCSAKAVQEHTQVATQHISYARSLPATVRKQTPQGAKSCFFGSFKLSAKEPQFLLHLFNPTPKQTASGYFGTYSLMLHIFKVGKTPRFQLVNSVPVDYRSIINRPRKFGAQLLWLDPKARRKPIIKFDCFDPNGINGAIGDNVLIVFPEGLQGKAVIQSLAFGNWHASDSS